MDFEALSQPAVGLLLITSVMLLVNLEWRSGFVALGLQYLAMFPLVALSWPADLAVVKLVAGWLAAAILALSRFNMEPEIEPLRLPLSGRLFRIFAASLVLIVVFSFAPSAVGWLPAVELPQVWGGLILIGMGLLNLGFSARPLRVVISLLTVLAGFEVLYAVVESSTLVAGLLAIINLSIAMVGAYLLSSQLLGPQSQ